MQTLTGTVFNIQRFSIHDGPGIRTTVFMKGCPLHCAWCHNPESHAREPELAFYPAKCTLCGACVAACPQSCHAIGDAHTLDRSRCVGCGLCAKACPFDALNVFGSTKTPEEVLTEVLKDKQFYINSGGGMTLSGGEPFSQPRFAIELLRLAKLEGLHNCVETCGFAPIETLEEAARHVDIFLYDIKETSPELHKKYTGVTNELILANLRRLDGIGVQTILRCPMIPGLNDRREHLLAVASLASELKNVLQVEIEPYHPLGLSKAEAIGKAAGHADSTTPPKEWAEGLAAVIRESTDKQVIIS